MKYCDFSANLCRVFVLRLSRLDSQIVDTDMSWHWNLSEWSSFHVKNAVQTLVNFVDWWLTGNHRLKLKKCLLVVILWLFWNNDVDVSQHGGLCHNHLGSSSICNKHTHLWQFAQTFWSKGREFHATFCAIAVAMTWEDLQQVSWQQLVVFAYFPASFFVNQLCHIVRATTIGWGWWFPMKSTIQKNLYQQIYGDLRRVIGACSKLK